MNLLQKLSHHRSRELTFQLLSTFSWKNISIYTQPMICSPCYQFWVCTSNYKNQCICSIFLFCFSFILMFHLHRGDCVIYKCWLKITKDIWKRENQLRQMVIEYYVLCNISVTIPAIFKNDAIFVVVVPSFSNKWHPVKPVCS